MLFPKNLKGTLPSKKRRKKAKKSSYAPKVSKAEVRFGKALDKHLRWTVLTQYKLEKKYYDFGLADHKVLIEFDGDYFHGRKLYVEGNRPTTEVLSKRTKKDRMMRRAIKNDIKKDRLAIGYKYLLIRVWETDYKERGIFIMDRIKSAIEEFIVSGDAKMVRV